jgi:hypothetical protein
VYSTPKLTGVLFSVAIGALLVGCNSVPMQKVADKWDTTRRNFNARVRPSQERIESVMVDPPADQATQLRGWDASTFLYPNGATLAYPTYGLNYEDRPKWLANDYYYSLASPAILLYDIVAMPVYMIMEPPTTAVAYHGVRQPPSMTLAPPLQTQASAYHEQKVIQQMKEQPQPEAQPTPPAQPNTPVAPPPSDKAEPAPQQPGGPQ